MMPSPNKNQKSSKIITPLVLIRGVHQSKINFPDSNTSTSMCTNDRAPATKLPVAAGNSPTISSKLWPNTSLRNCDTLSTDVRHAPQSNLRPFQKHGLHL